MALHCPHTRTAPTQGAGQEHVTSRTLWSHLHPELLGHQLQDPIPRTQQALGCPPWDASWEQDLLVHPLSQPLPHLPRNSWGQDLAPTPSLCWTLCQVSRWHDPGWRSHNRREAWGPPASIDVRKQVGRLWGQTPGGWVSRGHGTGCWLPPLRDSPVILGWVDISRRENVEGQDVGVDQGLVSLRSVSDATCGQGH